MKTFLSRFGNAGTRTEDFWAIWIGVGLIAIAMIAFWMGTSLEGLSAFPKKWQTFNEISEQMSGTGWQYLILFGAWSVLFSVAVWALGFQLLAFLVSFGLIFILSTGIIILGAWVGAEKFNLEPPLVALVIGLLISNFLKLPTWLKSGFRVEFYVKTGIVLLGATLPLATIITAGPVAIFQSLVISIVTFGVIFYMARRLGLDQRFAAVLGAGGAVCGVSASIAVAGAVGAKKEQAPVAISIVVFWAILMIFILPLISRTLQLPAGVAGAFIGTSEFADSAGFAAAQSYGDYVSHSSGVIGNAESVVHAFTMMKVVGRDLWIGIWAFVLSLIATTKWNTTEVQQKSDWKEIWRRFPKFVVGFVIASFLISVLTQFYSAAEFSSMIKPKIIAPLKILRTWTFTFSFLSIGLTTRWRELSGTSIKPFLAFSCGVVVNLALGFLLSVVIFGDYWTQFGLR